MTIDDLLNMATYNTQQASNSAGRSNLEFATVFALIAQAAAQTAQALIMRDAQLDIMVENDRAELKELWRQ